MAENARAGEEVIGLRGVRLFREGRLVLAGIDFSVRRGEHWVLLGPNGSGKSSLLSVLQGRLWPIEGEMRVLGRAFGESDLSELRRRIGWVGSDIEPEFPGGQSVEQIVLSGRVGTVGIKFDLPTARDRAEARRALRQAGILSLARRPYAFLSQGQRRLVTIARALMVRPGLLILDEPAAGLDPVAREAFLEKLGGLMRRGSGPRARAPVILYVTHHIEEIIPAFTHALLLRRGRALARGPLPSCLTAALLGRLFDRPVRVERREGRYSLRLAGSLRART